MKNQAFFLICFLVAVLSTITPIQAQTSTPLYVQGEVLVKFRKGASTRQMQKALQSMGVSAVAVQSFQQIGVQRLRLAKGANLEQAISRLVADANVEIAEPNYILSINPIYPNDSFFSMAQWGLHNTGQTIGGVAGIIDADIDAPEAWAVTTGSSDVLVAIIDTGIDYTHPDLSANLWTNPDEIPGNGFDDDGNGFVDDVQGWDFTNNDNDPFDDHGHGTHVAGTVGAVGNNGTGVTGVNWHVKMLPLKVFDASGSGTTAELISALNYALGKGVRLANYSGGGSGYSQLLHETIQQTNASGMLLVAAAGNSAVNTDLMPFYPASDDQPNVVSVAATDNQDYLSSFSNFGSSSVDLGAPGSWIGSTWPGNSYVYADGTSMASPHVAGVVALLWAYRPTLTNIQVKNLLLNSADPLPSLAGNTVTGGRLNAARALSNQLAIEVPATWVSGSVHGLLVKAIDVSGDVDTNFNEVVTLSLDSGTGFLEGITSVTAVNGVATYGNVTYTATVDGEQFSLVANDQDQVGTDLLAITSINLTADVVATQLVFTTQPAPLSLTSGVALDFSTDPVAMARDGNGVVDSDFTSTVILTVSGPGGATYANNTVDAVNGVASFSGMGLTYQATADGEGFSLTASTGSLATTNSNVFTADVVATQLVFTTQPAPLSAISGMPLEFSTDPVVEARDTNGIVDTGFTGTVTLTASGSGSAIFTNNSMVAVSGVATFDGLTATYTATADGEGFSLQASSESLTTATTNTLTADVVATQLVFATQPAGGVSGSTLSTQPVVRAVDATGLTDADINEVVSLTLSNGAGSLSGTLTGMAVNGVANFTNVVYTATVDGENFSLVANDQDGMGADLPAITSNSLTADVVATHLVFDTQPAPLALTSGVALDFSVDPVVSARDGNGVMDTDFHGIVDLAETGSGSATYTNNSVAAVAGVATFTGLTTIYTATVDGESFALQVSSDGLAATNSNNLSADVVATQLVWTIQPAGSVSGSSLSTQPVVRATDANDLTDAGFNEVLNLTLGSGTGTLSGTLNTTAVNGVATFGDVTYTTTTDGEGFSLSVNDDDGVGADLPATTSSNLTVDVVATHLVFDTQPAPLTTISGVALDFGTDPVVSARDGNEGLDTDFSGTVVLMASGSGTATYANNSVSATNGMASFAGMGLTYNATADGETFALAANSGSLVASSSNNLTADVVATQLVFATQPAPLGLTSGVLLDFSTDPVVEARDAQGVKDTDFNGAVILTASGVGSATYTSNLVTAVAGVAAFNGLTTTYTATANHEAMVLQASSGNLNSATSSPLTAVVVAARLVFSVYPVGGVSGNLLDTQPEVRAIDANGLTDASFNEMVTLTLGSGTGSLSGTLSATAVSGVATFSDVRYTAIVDGESFSVVANDQDGVGTDLAGVTSGALTADVVATKLVFATQPSPLSLASGVVLDFSTDPVVEAQDAQGIKDTDFTGTVTLVASGPGSGMLTNNHVAAVAGVATFTGLTTIYTTTVDGESFALQVSSDGLAATNSNNLSADVVATQLVWTIQPAGSVSGSSLSTQPVVRATDANGLTDAGFNEVVGLNLGSGSGSLSGTLSVLAVNGVASFANVAYTAPVDGEQFSLAANDQDGMGADLPAITSIPLAADVVATHLVFDTQPAPLSLISGVMLDFSTDPVVGARDGNGVKDTGFTGSVTLIVTGPSSATCINNTVVSVAGVATFTGLTTSYTATADGETFALQANSAGLGSAASMNLVASKPAPPAPPAPVTPAPAPVASPPVAPPPPAPAPPAPAPQPPVVVAPPPPPSDPCPPGFPTVTVSVDQMVFGSAPINTEKEGHFNVANTGGGCASVSLFITSGQNRGWFTATPTSLKIKAGEVKNVVLRFLPQAAAAAKAILAVDAGNAYFEVGLNGEGVLPVPVFVTETSSIDFGSVPVGQSLARPLKVWNKGGVDLFISAVTSSIPSLTAAPQSLSIPPGGSAEVAVSFSPLSAAAMSGTVNIAHNGSASPYALSVLGLGVDTTPPAVPTGLTATINGEVSLNWVASAESDLMGTVIYRSINAEFSPAPTDSVGWAAKGTSTFTVAQPTGKAYYYRIAAVDTTGNHSAASAPVTALRSAEPNTPPLQVSRSEVNFGSILVGVRQEEQIVVKNTAKRSIRLTFTVTGSDSPQFQLGSERSTLRPGQEMTLSLAFAPTSPGNKAGLLVIAYTGGVAPLTVPLQAVANAPGPVVVSRPSVDFGTVGIRSRRQESIVVRNTSRRPIILALSLSDTSQFQVSPRRTTIGSGQVKTITITFAPGRVGKQNASLNLTAGGTSLSVALSGNAVNSRRTASKKETVESSGLEEVMPAEAGLRANYPNPFNPSTTIPYVLAEAGWVKLNIYNMLGQEVRVLVDQVQAPGSYMASWDGSDNAGLPASSGTYFYRLETGSFAQVAKMTLAR